MPSISVADPWEGPGGAAPPPPFVSTKMRPEGPKKNFWETGHRIDVEHVNSLSDHENLLFLAFSAGAKIARERRHLSFPSTHI